MGEVVKNIMEIMEEIAPTRCAEPWDKVGLLVGNSLAPVKKVMVTLDVTSKVIEDAIKQDVDLIISHHPVIFKSIEAINDNSVTGSILLMLIRNGISVYSAHTNYDKVANGVDDTLAEILGLDNIHPLAKESYCIDSCQPYFGRIGKLPEKFILKDYLLSIKEVLKSDVVQFIGDPDRQIQTVASCAGSGGDFIDNAIRAGADLYITGEAKYHEALSVLESDMAIAKFGHYFTEQPAIYKLIDRLQKTVDDLQYNIEIIPSIYYGSCFKEL